MGLHQELPEQVENERQVGQGTSQRQRFSPELEPSVVLVDERSIEHDMVFAKNYAAYLDFVNAKGEKTATWEQFFGSDSTVLLAEAALFDIDRYRQAIGKGLTFLTKHQDDTVEHQLKATLLALFGIAGKLAAKLDSFQQQLPEELPLTTSLRFRIQSELAVPFRNLISAYRAGLELGLYGEDDAPDTGLCGPDCPPAPYAPGHVFRILDNHICSLLERLYHEHQHPDGTLRPCEIKCCQENQPHWITQPFHLVFRPPHRRVCPNHGTSW